MVTKKDLDWRYKLERLCDEFYESSDVKKLVKKISAIDNKDKEVVIKKVTKHQIEFLHLLRDLRYINAFDIYDGTPPSA